jgi:hypothetical protein
MRYRKKGIPRQSARKQETSIASVFGMNLNDVPLDDHTDRTKPRPMRRPIRPSRQVQYVHGGYTQPSTQVFVPVTVPTMTPVQNFPVQVQGFPTEFPTPVQAFPNQVQGFPTEVRVIQGGANGIPSNQDDMAKIRKLQDDLQARAQLYVEETKAQREALMEFLKKYSTEIASGVVVFSALFFYFYSVFRRIPRYLSKMSIYNVGGLKSIQQNSQYILDKYRLCDFYVASAFRAYLPCTNYFDYASEDAVKECIIYGARYVHLDVFPSSFDADAVPVCCAGEEVGNWHYTTKVKFDVMCDTIKTVAFSNLVQNNTDPFFIHITFKCWGNTSILNKCAVILRENFESRLLDPKFGYNGQYSGANLPLTYIGELLEKVIIICDSADNDNIVYSKMNELSNFNPNMGGTCRYMTYEQVRNTYDMKELREYNKKQVTIVRPSYTAREKMNYNFYTPYYLGCQFLSMNYTNPDAFMQNYVKRFGEYSFVLKPKKLQYEPVLIAPPLPQNPALSSEPIQYTTMMGGGIS